MPNRYALAVLMTLAAIPAAAQTPQPAKEPTAPKPFVVDIDALPKPFVVDVDALPKPMVFDYLAKELADVRPALDALTAAKVASFDYDLNALSSIEPVLANARSIAENVAYSGYALASSQARDRDAELRDREREREAQYYNEGQNAAMESRYDRALQFFNRVIEMRGSKLDAALYWKAYAQNRIGQRTEALSTLAELSKNHPNSSYRKQGTVLEAEVRRDVGQPVRPQDSTDDEVKLMALQALQNTAPEEAIPMLEKVLEGTSSPRVKRRALFVLSQSKSPRAREVLRNYAKGSSTRELQSQAIEYLGVHGGTESRAMLGDIYAGSTDVEVKRRILRAFMVAGEKDRLFKAAQGEQNAELRAEAVSQLGNMQAHEELWQLYQKETAVDVKRRIIRSIQNAGNVDRLIEVAKSEQNPELRREAVRGLGVMRSARTGDVLVQIYGSSSDVDIKKAAVNALFIQENATALVALARKEQDMTMQKEIVSKLANMRSKIATDYMIELLGK